MKKKAFFISIFLALFLAFPWWGYAFAENLSKKPSVTLSGKISKDETWKQFTSSEGRFSALFPSNPKEEVETVDSAIGPLNIHFFLSEKENSWFAVSYSDYPYVAIQAVDVSELLDGARDGMVANVRGKLISEKPISLGNYPGRELVVEVSKGPFVFVTIARVYIVKNRHYSVQVVILKKLSSSKTVWEFLDSFSVTETPEELSTLEFMHSLIHSGPLAPFKISSQHMVGFVSGESLTELQQLGAKIGIADLHLPSLLWYVRGFIDATQMYAFLPGEPRKALENLEGMTILEIANYLNDFYNEHPEHRTKLIAFLIIGTHRMKKGLLPFLTKEEISKELESTGITQEELEELMKSFTP